MIVNPLLQYRALLAPMEGVMTPWFVRVCSRLRLVPHWITPFLSVTGGAVPSRAAIRKRLVPFTESGLPVTLQLMGKDADGLAQCAKHAVEACTLSGINLNFACPSRTVTGKGAGSGILDDPELLEKLVSSVRNALPESVPLSVKLRTGFRTSHPETVVKAACSGGADLLIVHFRIGKEMYEPVENPLERLRIAVEAAGKIPVYGNGDIRTEADAERMRRETGCIGVAAARGFLVNPVLINQLNGLPDSRKIVLADEIRKERPPACLVRELQRMAAEPVPQISLRNVNRR